MTTELNGAILHFREQYMDRVWGGDKLRTVLDKPTPDGDPIGEAWMISDHPSAVSEVDEGPLKGTTLHDLLEADTPALLGSRVSPTIHGRFPLLLKLLDAGSALSVQVHPDDATAADMGEPDVGKTEMWHVLEADPGSQLMCGLNPELTAAEFAGAVEDGSIESHLTSFDVDPGDSVFVTAGTVHAIGGGTLLAEIQQNSDLTYRIYDWGRVGTDGQPRELHVEKSERAIHFGSLHSGKAAPLSYVEGESTIEIHAACRYFAAARVLVSGAYKGDTRGESFHILLGVSGGLEVCTDESRRVLPPGEAVLLPGVAGSYEVHGEGTFLQYWTPDLARDVTQPLTEAGHDAAAIVALGGDPAHSDLA